MLLRYDLKTDCPAQYVTLDELVYDRQQNDNDLIKNITEAATNCHSKDMPIIYDVIKALSDSLNQNH